MAETAPPSLPSLHASHSGCWLRDRAGTRAVGKGEAIMAASDTPLLLLNAPLLASRLGYPDLSGLDLLELFAFVHPARFAVPTLPADPDKVHRRAREFPSRARGAVRP